MMQRLLGSVITAILIESLWIGLLFGCASVAAPPAYSMKVKPGCVLTYLDFGTGQGLQCYCKIEALKEDQTKAYIYMPMAAQDCNH